MGTLEERMRALPKARREKIEKRAEELHKEYTMIRRLRELFELTQKEFEEKTGIWQSVLSKLKNGEQKITFFVLSMMIDSLGGEWEFNIKLPKRKKITLVGSDMFRDEA
jgi:transcriptional regulator with XRE-family HTH domain